MVTVKQKIALDKMVENGGNMSKAMIEAGYSPNTARTPGKMTTTKGWAELMKKHFPDSKLANLHKRLLEKKEVLVVSDGPRDGSHLEWTGQPHTDAMRALDIAYKLKGSYPSEEGMGNKTLVVIIAGQSGARYGVSSTQEPRDSGGGLTQV